MEPMPSATASTDSASSLTWGARRGRASVGFRHAASCAQQAWHHEGCPARPPGRMPAPPAHLSPPPPPTPPVRFGAHTHAPALPNPPETPRRPSLACCMRVSCICAVDPFCIWSAMPTRRGSAVSSSCILSFRISAFSAARRARFFSCATASAFCGGREGNGRVDGVGPPPDSRRARWGKLEEEPPNASRAPNTPPSTRTSVRSCTLSSSIKYSSMNGSPDCGRATGSSPKYFSYLRGGVRGSGARLGMPSGEGRGVGPAGQPLSGLHSRVPTASPSLTWKTGAWHAPGCR